MSSTSSSGRAASVRRRHPTLILMSAILLLAAAFVNAPVFATDMEAVGYYLRVTARVAFVFFLLAYIARPIAQMTGARILLYNRRYLGLAMALAHKVHFSAVVTYLTISGEAQDWVVLVFAGLAFVVMWLMALTSNDKSVQVLGRYWRWLHRFGLHYLWLIFMQTWIGVLVSGDGTAGVSVLYAVMVAARQ